ncbi:MAG: hypothetical protein Q7S51_05730 [Gallionellaceae bacterium]|nr:hypothetical protein [Gallionellaceae bacterium]
MNRLILALAVCVLSGTMSGCGGGGGTSSSTTSVTGVATPGTISVVTAN